MYVRHLSVADFRSWTRADVDFDPGPSVLVGANGQGKTNLVEAAGYLATLGSHRVATDAPLVRAGAERAVVAAAVVSEGRELQVEVEITPGRANRARLNRGAVPRPRDILGVLRLVLFAPEDLAIVRGDPSERRRFLDDVLVQRTPRMAGVRADYDRVLKQRAALLKTAGHARRAGSAGDLRTLDVWDDHLAAHGSALLAARLDLLDELREPVTAAYRLIAPTSDPIVLRYHSALPDDALAARSALAATAAGFASGAGGGAGTASGRRDEAVLAAAMRAELARVRPQEIERGVTLVGPHRDDLVMSLGELPLRGYASHGESWSAALALRLGSYELLRSDGIEPVLVLDDVFAELDGSRRDQLAGVAAGAEQVLITAAVAEDVPRSSARAPATTSTTVRSAVSDNDDDVYSDDSPMQTRSVSGVAQVTSPSTDNGGKATEICGRRSTERPGSGSGGTGGRAGDGRPPAFRQVRGDPSAGATPPPPESGGQQCPSKLVGARADERIHSRWAH